MHDLTPQSALGAQGPSTLRFGSITVTENDQRALASVAARRGQETACASALEGWLGASPPAPGHAIEHGGRAALWMAPDQWLLSAPFKDFEDVTRSLQPVFSESASLTEQTDAWVCFDMEGAGVVDMFERLCALPVRRARTGDAQRTTLHHMSCFVICLETAARMRVLGPRSSAASLHHALVTAAKAVA